MFCPRCGANNLDDSKFCRACGADIHLVPQALSLQLPESPADVIEVEEQEGEGKKGRIYKFKEPPTLEKGLENVFVGVAFTIIFMLGYFYYSGKFIFWIWLIIPALACFGEGLGQIIRSRQAARMLPPAPGFRTDAHTPPPARAKELPAPDTSEIAGAYPLSVTENTTRSLSLKK